MPEMPLYLHLSADLVFDVVDLELGLEQDLEGDKKFRPLFSGQVDVPELPSSQRAAELKVVQGPGLRILCCRHYGAASAGQVTRASDGARVKKAENAVKRVFQPAMEHLVKPATS